VITKDETAYVDVQEAAKMLGVSQRAVRNLVARGRLESKRDGEGVAVRLLVSVASVEKPHLEQ
jgi:excisionase family DNA binding protein